MNNRILFIPFFILIYFFIHFILDYYFFLNQRVVLIILVKYAFITFNGYKKRMEKYISYTKYGNKKIIEMLNTIFKKAGKNVGIIIQGDHGFREAGPGFPDEARSGILNAIYLPKKITLILMIP